MRNVLFAAIACALCGFSIAYAQELQVSAFKSCGKGGSLDGTIVETYVSRTGECIGISVDTFDDTYLGIRGDVWRSSYVIETYEPDFNVPSGTSESALCAATTPTKIIIWAVKKEGNVAACDASSIPNLLPYRVIMPSREQVCIVPEGPCTSFSSLKDRGRARLNELIATAKEATLATQ
ncbi:hypothetical protein A3A38_00850 [Candidatus Kaiserbacteria bacterium RIFCSPLOWO2_01_FULL_53_17]|uniref:Uncharacterized protein n=1 Tax=Candidatus Kaiserbacteria bacterium RIFCSPLOWO2_01_FULL_53_17 TaxID=1798511 RepID=A0A1F6EGF3_9BACT|nr:MAG: hypothetical protein A3A38_00850 [Candidatus Kaiserbacteria bacterium RIFCSPLOWO2_01_FULL_53_17]